MLQSNMRRSQDTAHSHNERLFFKKVQLCIIDESSMMQRILFEQVDAVLKGMRCSEQARDGIGLREIPARRYENRTCRRIPAITSSCSC